ncbi:putative glycosyl transferase [Deltalipothrixvirus pozzuoliense]|uniref:Putative glycosyltransferase ORF330 n=1 Tax=Acidianus filamentous virus 2 (isolate Italy/Pozzuoli) TaxID=654910 RepID=GT330_AFV2P|nr:glycosyltransferase [Acidianus filamentous virus 2]Q573D6.1 RecName: Full=Putative glycosyltransferase ORF330 [Acidianus filamentous virus 2 (isolate Pozzuoli)]CAH69420.1 putative glycosyl transferase [Acidianus filamentous virus 2]
MIISKQCSNCSFDVVATQFVQWLQSYRQQQQQSGNHHVVDIILQKIGCGGDIEFIDINLWWSQCRTIDEGDAPHSVVRGDSPYAYITNVSDNEISDHLLVTTSQYNASMFRKLFRHIEVVPHAYDPLEVSVVDKVKEKKFDVITIGYDTADDHKGLTVARKVALDLSLRYVEVSNQCDNVGVNASTSQTQIQLADNMICIPFMTLTREDVYRLIAQSRFYLALSHTEGFGLPVLESMVAGTVPIYVDGHAFHEYAKGIPIPAYSDKRVDWYNYEYEDVVEVVKSAMSTSQSEYNELSMRVKEESRHYFHPDVVYRKLINIVNKNVKSNLF